MNGESRVEVINREGWRKEYPLQKGIIYIGSATTNDIVLNGMQGAGVAPLHAQLIANQTGYKLINLADAEIALGESGGDVLPPRAVIDLVDGLTFGVGEFILVFRGGGGGYDFGVTGGAGNRFIGLNLVMPYVRLAPHQSLEGRAIVQNLGGKTGVHVDVDLEGLDADCYDVAPGPLLSSGAEGEVLFRIHHRGLKPLAGDWYITLRAAAPRDYPGEEAVVSQKIEVLPFYRHQLRLFPPGSVPEALDVTDFLSPKAKSGSLTGQDESRSNEKKGEWWTTHSSWGQEQEPMRMRARSVAKGEPVEAADPNTPAASSEAEEEPWGWQAKEAVETSPADTRPVVVAGEGEWGWTAEEETIQPAEPQLAPTQPETPVEPEPAEKKRDNDVSEPTPPVAVIPPQTPQPAQPPPEKVVEVSEPVAAKPAPVSVDKQVEQSVVDIKLPPPIPPEGSEETKIPPAGGLGGAEATTNVSATPELSWWQRFIRALPFGRRAEPGTPDTEESRQADKAQVEIVEEPQAALAEPSPPLPSDEAPPQKQALSVAVETPPPNETVVEPEPVSPTREAEKVPPLAEMTAEQPSPVTEEAESPPDENKLSQTMPAVPSPAGVVEDTQPVEVETGVAIQEAGSKSPEAVETLEVIPEEPPEPPMVTPEPRPPETKDEMGETPDVEPETKTIEAEAATEQHQPEMEDETRETADDVEPKMKAGEAEAATELHQSEAEDETEGASAVETEPEPDEMEDLPPSAESSPTTTTEATEAAEAKAVEAEDWLVFEEKKERKVIKLRADTASLPVENKEERSDAEELWTAD